MLFSDLVFAFLLLCCFAVTERPSPLVYKPKSVFSGVPALQGICRPEKPEHTVCERSWYAQVPSMLSEYLYQQGVQKFRDRKTTARGPVQVEDVPILLG